MSLMTREKSSDVFTAPQGIRTARLWPCRARPHAVAFPYLAKSAQAASSAPCQEMLAGPCKTLVTLDLIGRVVHDALPGHGTMRLAIEFVGRHLL